MSKRRATDELYGDSTKRLEHPGRREAFTASLRALNSSFAVWVQQQAAQAGDQLWLRGVNEYASHAEKLLDEFDDVLLNGKQHRSSPPVANNLFGTPAPAAAIDTESVLPGPLSAGAPGDGRKSVTFAPGPTSFSTPGGPGAAATGTAATPGTSNTTNAGHTPAPGTSNTANAGHTPAPASGLNFQFTPPGAAPGSGSGMFSPQPFKLGAAGATPGSAGDNGATPSPAPSSVFTFGNGGNASDPGTHASTVGFGTPLPTPAAGGKGFTFGASSSTPAGQDGPAAAAGTSSSGVAFSFGTTPAAGSSGVGATPATAGSTGGFSFGAMPAAATAAGSGTSSNGGTITPGFGGFGPTAASGGGGSVPAFGFASTGAGGSSAAGGFKFPAPAAAAAGAADGAADAEAEAEDGDEPPKHKLELKVDESVWNVLFSAKTRLYVSVNNAWDTRGVGMLTLRQKKDDAAVTYVMFSTDVGKQLVASQLLPSNKVNIIPTAPKKCTMRLLVLQYTLPQTAAKAEDGAAAAKPAAQFGEKVQELARLVQEHKPPKPESNQE